MMRRYEKYKDSGVEWIGEVPEHWETMRIKFALCNSKSGIWGEDEKEDENDVVCFRVADFDYSHGCLSFGKLTIRNVPAPQFKERSISKGSLLIEKSGGGDNWPVGRVVRYNYCKKATCSNFVHFIEFKDNFDSNYFYYYFFDIYANKVNLLYFNQTTGIQNLKVSDYLSQSINIPSLPEQKSIASYLDSKVGKIDDMIEKTEKKIGLYEELKKSIITRAVTKGLNPNAKMKDSGVDWIGEIPEDWEVAKLRRVSKIRTGTTPPTSNQSYFNSEDIEWYTPCDFESDKIILNGSSRKLSRNAYEEGKIYLYPSETTLIIGIGGTLGKIGWIDKESASNQQINAIITNKDNLSKYYAYYLFIQNSYIWSMANTSTMPILNQTSTKDLIVPIPSKREQYSIAIYLDSKTSAIDSQISIARKRIDLLKELKSSLITNVVTGKIKVC